MANRVSFVVDGFNLYHSLKYVSKRKVNPLPCRWLDLSALCASTLQVIGGGATLQSVYYFSALAAYREATNPGVMARHNTYADAIRSTGVYAEFARFQKKDVKCPKCTQDFVKHEEKQTDVAVGIRVLETALSAAADTIVIVSADSDLIPAVQRTRQLFPALQLYAAFPFGVSSKHLRRVVHRAFSLSDTEYQKYQLPDPVVLPSGRKLAKPTAW